MRTLIELIRNEATYAARFQRVVGPFNEAIKNIGRNFTYSELYEIAALSKVLKCDIRSVYPMIDYRQDLSIMNHTFRFVNSTDSPNVIYLFWSHARNETDARNMNGGNWTPNHFVPLVVTRVDSPIELAPPKANHISSKTVSPK